MSKTKNTSFFHILLGIALALVVTIVGNYGAQLVGQLLVSSNILPEGSASPISGIFVAILIGMILRNTIGIHNRFERGIQFTLKYGLRLGIILLGLRLSFAEAFKFGAWGLPIIVFSIGCGLIVTLYFTNKMKESLRLGALIAAGTSICGVTAIMAIAPVIEAKDDEISYAVGNITIFGLIGMLVYPYLAPLLFDGDAVQAGFFLGTAVHDTAQVTGSALIYSELHDAEEVINVATVTKLTRNLFLILVIPLLAFFFFKRDHGKTGDAPTLPKWYKFIPGFVILFLLMSVVRTIGDVTLESSGLAFKILEKESWESFYNSATGLSSNYLLAMAMASVGLSTDLSKLKSLGMRPFYIGLIAAISVGIVSFILVTILGPYIKA